MEILNLGDFMINKIKKYICYFVIMSSIFTISGCSNNNEDELLKSKLESEMKYLDSTLTDMLNKANGINFQNYQVSAEKIEQQKSQNDQSSDSSSQQQSSQAEQSSGGESSSSSTSDSASSEDESKKNNARYEMVENTTLTQQRTPEWEALTGDIENIYSDWSVITLDLYKQNVESQKILRFNNDLDNVAKAIKDKNKEQTLATLAILYSHIPNYYADFSQNQMQTNLYKAKSSVFNAYALIEQNNPNEVKKQLQVAEEAVIAMMNNMESKKEYNINKAYILLKDLQNTIDKNDADIFYLKYKNLMSELNIL